jgi:ligand-binding sensor domain-containing protein
MRPIPGFLLCTLLFLLQLPANALDPNNEPLSFSHRRWSKREGMPQNSALAMAQTPDGYLWVGTHEGLARFDGISFKTYTPRTVSALGAKAISALSVGIDGTLWIGTMGGGITTMRDGVFRSACNGLEESPMNVGRFFHDRSGNVWAVTSKGLQMFRDGCLVRTFTWSTGLPKGPVTGIAEDRPGRLLIAVGGHIMILQGEGFEEYPLPAPVRGKVRLIVADSSGTLWIGTYEHGVAALRGTHLTVFDRARGLSSDSIGVLLVDRRGAVWVATRGGGVNRIYRERITAFGSHGGLLGDEMVSLLEDREGSIWVGGTATGLNCFSDSKFTTYATGEGSARDFVYSVYADPQGGVLAGSASHEVWRVSGGRLVPFGPFRKPLAGIPLTFHRDRHGALWIGTTQGLYRVRGGQTEYYPLGFVHAVAEDSHGLLWVGANTTLWFRVNGVFREWPGWSSGVGPNSFIEEADGSMWVGSRQAGVFRFAVRRDSLPASKGFLKLLEHHSAKEGLGANWVGSMILSADGRLWIATYGAGLRSLKDGKLVSLAESGPPEEGFHSLVEDNEGSLWLSSNNGVYRIWKKDVDSVLAGRATSYPWTQFGVSAGMVSDECNGGGSTAAAKTPDGNLWFPTAVGVAMVNPSSLSKNTVAPTVVLERASADRHDVAPEGKPVFPPGDGELEFVFIGISLSAPEQVRYRVRLEGFDREWRDIGGRRVHSYTNIAPGTYVFRVNAANADGAWSPQPASFTFTLEPHYYQTWWFTLLCVTAAIGCVFGLAALYRRRREREVVAARLESQLAQAQLQVLEMQVQPHFLFNTLNSISVLIRTDPEKAVRMIGRLSEFVRLGLDRSGKQEIPLHEELKLVERYLEIESVRFADRLTVRQSADEGTLDALVPSMILQPLVENAVRHGISRRRGPVMISVEAARQNGELRMSVRDTGAGLPEGWNEHEARGIGLSNTRSRLEQLYGSRFRFRLDRDPEGGTVAEVAIPFHQELTRVTERSTPQPRQDDRSRRGW